MRLNNWLFTAAALVIVIAGLRSIAEILNLVFATALIAILVYPVQKRLQQRGLPKMVALLLVMLLIVVIGMALVIFLTVSVNQVIDKLPTYQTRFNELERAIERQLSNLTFIPTLDNFVDTFDFQPVIQLVVQFLRLFVESLSNVLLVFFMTFFMLLDVKVISHRLQAALGSDHPMLQRLQRYTDSVRHYIWIRTVFGLLIAGMQTILMLVMGVDFAVQWGVLSFIGNFIPNVGFVIGLIPPVVIALLELGVGPTLVLIVLYTVINNVVENWVFPQFTGEQLNVSPLIIFVSLIFWVWVVGWLGAVLAVPLTLLVKIVLLDGRESLRWLDAIISAPIIPSSNQPDT